MNDWKEFLEQAHQDMAGCEALRSVNNYGNSAYLLQQGLEKYIKAYLFKFQLFSGKPHEIGHLPIKVMWNKLIDELERKIRTFNNPELKTVFQQSATIMKLIKELFDKIKNPNNRSWKTTFWKKSLNIPLNNNEELIINNEKEKLEKEFTRIIPMMETLLAKLDPKKKLENLSEEQRIKIEKQLVEKMGIHLDDLLKIFPTVQSGLHDVQSGMPDFFLILGDIIKQDIQSKDQYAQDLFNILRLAWLFSFRDEIVEMFTHEDIGRYPTEILGTTSNIDSKSSREIYEINVKELDSLIERVKKKCDEIESVLI